MKNREHYEEASNIFKAGWSNDIKICVTSEFKNEITRNSTENTKDTILQFAKNLPSLPPVSQTYLDPIIEEIGAIIFPDKKAQRKYSKQDKSDLSHIASSIHHKINGFITRENAILDASDIIYQSYGLEILSPCDFNNSRFEDDLKINQKFDVLINKSKVLINNFSEKDRELLEKFLLAIGDNLHSIPDILLPGTTTSPRERKTITVDGEVIGIASWCKFSRFKNETDFFLYIDENCNSAKNVIDHLLEHVGRVCESQFTNKINLISGNNQSYTKQSALQRGYCQGYNGEGKPVPGKLSKVLFRGVITHQNWHKFSCDFKEFTNYSLPAILPNLDEFNNTGIPISNNPLNKNCFIKLFDFETLISPGIVFCPKRESIILPIKRQYAEELLGNFSKQGKLFSSAEALLHVEKAYFKKPRNKEIFSRGIPLFFYVSGTNSGYKQIIGVGRVTYSDYLSIDEIEINLSRQGVLPHDELMQLAGKQGKVHVVTFDNFNLLPNFVPFNFLKQNGIINGSNLVTAEKISSKNTVKLYEEGFIK